MRRLTTGPLHMTENPILFVTRKLPPEGKAQALGHIDTRLAGRAPRDRVD